MKPGVAGGEAPRRAFELAASAVAALLLSFAGYMLWRGDGSVAPRVREVTVAWRCAPADGGGACVPTSDVERCTTCHFGAKHAHPFTINLHAGLGCVACHGGNGAAMERTTAHDGLASLGRGGEVPAVEARCATCHADTRTSKPSAARDAWRRWLALQDGLPPPRIASPKPDEPDLASTWTAGRALFGSLRCGACHVATDASPIATPLDTLALRSTKAELVTALAVHAARGGVDLDLVDKSAVAVATYLRSIVSPEAATAMLHRASVPGSSADEGRVLAVGLGCAACHDAATKDDGRLHVDLAQVATTRNPDWIAYFLANPIQANAASTMPSLRLSAREAASLARHLVAATPSTEPSDSRGDSAGESIVQTRACGSCHAPKLSPGAPALARYGEMHDGAAAITKLSSHLRYRLDDAARRALATYLVSQVGTRVRDDVRVLAHDGDEAFGSLGCGGCHVLDAFGLGSGDARLSLFGEGLRVRPQWLFEFLRAPERHAVRPPLHPEWAYRELVPADRVTMRMPTFSLDDVRMTSLVRFFSERDGAAFPYAMTPPVMLTGEALTGAIGDLTRKDRGGCTSCHTIAVPDAARARADGDKLAPPLSLAHERLRAAWIEACIVQPNDWVVRMPAFTRSPAEVERVRDLVLLLRDRTVLPAAGAEGLVPALGLGDLP